MSNSQLKAARRKFAGASAVILKERPLFAANEGPWIGEANRCPDSHQRSSV
jgi:hypothetical protein